MIDEVAAAEEAAQQQEYRQWYHLLLHPHTR
jgi:hypothetical protein